MFPIRKPALVVVVGCIFSFIAPMLLAQNQTRNEKAIQRYKLMLQRRPKEGSTFDRLYQFYLEGPGLDTMILDYQAEAKTKPNTPNLQLILGHVYKRLGKDQEAILAYQRAVELAPDDYYPYLVLGQTYVIRRRYEAAVSALTQAADLSTYAQSATSEERIAIFKALGRAHLGRDQVDQAIAAWQRISEIEPHNIFSRIELVDAFREQTERSDDPALIGELYAQAIAQHEAIIDLKPDDPYRVCLSRREIGEIHEDMGNYEVAIQNYDAALALTAPGNWLRKDLQQRIIDIYAHNGDWPSLIAYYQAKLNPSSPALGGGQKEGGGVELIGLLASAYIENQQIDEGIAQYRKGLQLAPTHKDLRLKLIGALRAAERFAEAAAEYEVISEQLERSRIPGHISGELGEIGVYRELGELYLKLDAPEKARATYQRIIDRHPNDAGRHLLLAEIYAGHAWFEDASAEYEKAIALAPDNLDYIEYFGEFYFYRGNRQKTVETWNRMVTGAHAIAANYSRLAELLDAKNFQAEAVAASQKAVEFAPEAYRYREALAERLMESKNYDEALREYAEAAKLAPNAFFAEQMNDQMLELFRRQGVLATQIEALEKQANLTFDQHKQLAKMYLKLGNVAYALEALNWARDAKPDDVPINRQLAEIYMKQGRRGEAISIYKHLSDVDGGNAREYYAAISQLHQRTMDFDAATEAARQVIAHSPRRPEGYQLLAQVAKRTGDFNAAIDAFRQAVRLRPESTNTRAEFADAYKQAGNHRQAIEQYWRCWDLSDTLDAKLAFTKPLSDIYYEMGWSSRFEEKLKQMEKVNPSDMAPVLALAMLYRVEGDLSGVQGQLARALENAPENPDLLLQLVRVSLDLGDMQEALVYQQRLVKAQPEAFHRQRLGELLFDMGREGEAIQTWTQLIHAKNQGIEAEIRLADLFIQRGLLDEARSVLDRAGERATDAQTVYQVGALLVTMNELDRALPYFQRILEMSRPAGSAAFQTHSKRQGQTLPAYTSPKQAIYFRSKHGYGLPGFAGLEKFYLPQSIIGYIQQSYRGRGGMGWQPSSFYEIQAAALAQLVMMAHNQGDFELSPYLATFEERSAANPKDLRVRETLIQIYLIAGNIERVQELTDELIALSPTDPTYQALRLTHAIDERSDYETVKRYLDDLRLISPEAWIWYTSHYVGWLRGRAKEKAETLLSELQRVEVTDIETALMLVQTFIHTRKLDAAERLFAQIPLPTRPVQRLASSAGSLPSSSLQQWQQYIQIYQTFADTYLRQDELDEGITCFLTLLELTRPKVVTPRRVTSLASGPPGYRGQRATQSTFPAPNTYYDPNRIRILQRLFSQLWMRDTVEPLYTRFHAAFETAEGADRIDSGLALSYFYWWDGQRQKAREILASLQRENPDNLTLKLNTAYVAIQTGEHKRAMSLFSEIASRDPRNARRYYDLMLQLAFYTDDIAKVRELLTKILNSSITIQELQALSQRLQNEGLTGYAIPVAMRAMKLAMRHHDARLLMQLSRELDKLGRGQDAAHLAARVMHFANRRDRYGRVINPQELQEASRFIGGSSTALDREAKLIQGAEKRPGSFRAQVDLAIYYESLNQIGKAANAFENALALRPMDTITRSRYAKMLKQAGRVEAAATQYIILIETDAKTFGNNTSDVIETLFRAQKLDLLISMAKKSIGTSNNRISGYTRRSHSGHGIPRTLARDVAQYCLNNGRPEVAIEIYEKMSAEHPEPLHFHIPLAFAYAAVGDSEKAIAYLLEKLDSDNPALAKNPNIRRQMVIKLVELYGTADREKAIAFLHRILEAEWASTTYQGRIWSEVIFSLVELYTVADSDKASEFLLTLLDSNHPAVSQNEDMRLQVGMKLIELSSISGKMDELVQKYKAQLANQPDNNLLTFFLALIQIEAGELQESDRLVEKLLNDDEFIHQEQLNQLLMAYRAAGDVEREIRMLELLIKKQNFQAGRHWYEQLAAAYAQKGDREKTEKILRKTGAMRIITSGGSWQEKREVATQFMQHEMWDDAERLYKEVMNDLLVQLRERQQIEQRLLEIQRRRAGPIDKSVPPGEKMNIGTQRALAQQYIQRNDLMKATQLFQRIIEAVPEDHQSRIQLAQLYSNQGKLDQAIEQWQALLEADPENTRYQDGLVNAYQQARKTSRAIALVQKAIENDPTSFQYARLARVYQGDSRINDAVSAYQKAIELNPGDVDVRQQLAQLYLSRNNLRAAEHTFQEALQYASQEHERSNIERQLMQIYQQQGKLEAVIREAEAEGRLTSEMLQQAAQYYWGRGKLEKAVEANKKAMDLTAQRWQRDSIINHLLELYAQLGQTKQAVEMYNTSSSGSGKRRRGPERLIQAYRNHGNLADLASYFEARREKEPDNVAVLETVAEIHRIRRAHEKAADSYQALAKLQPSNITHFYHAAVAYYNSNQSELAAEMLKRARVAISVHQDRGHYSFAQNLATICLRGRMYDEAVRLFKEAIAQSRRRGEGGSNEFLYRELGRSYLGLQRYDDAIEAFEQMMKRVRHDEGRKRGMHQLRQAYRQAGRYDALIAQHLQAVEDTPDAPDAYYTLARTYQWAGMSDEATAAYERAFELNPDNREVQETLARRYRITLMNTTQFKRKIEGMHPNLLRMLAGKYMHNYSEANRAIVIFKHLLAQNPEDGKIRENLARSYSTQDRHEETIPHYDALLKANPESVGYLSRLLYAYQQVGDLSALPLLETQIEDDPRELDYINLAQFYAAHGRLDDANNAVQRAIELNPEEGHAYRELVWLHLHQNDIGAAEHIIQEALTSVSDRGLQRRLSRQLMQIYRLQGRLAEMLQQAEAEGRLNAEMQREIGLNYLRQGNFGKAVEAYQKAMNLAIQDSQRDELSKELVHIHAQFGHIESVVEFYENEARFRSPHQNHRREEIIKICNKHGKLGVLLTYFEDRRKAEPENPWVLETVAHIHRLHGNYTQAAENYRVLCELQPGNVEGFYHAAAAFNKSGQTELAAEMLHQGNVARTRHEQGHQAHFLDKLARICLDGKLYDAAIFLFEEAITGYESFRQGGAEHMHRYLAIGQSHFSLKRYGKAIEAYQRLANLADNTQTWKEAQDAMRKAYKLGGIYEQLITVRLQAVEANPNDPDAHYALAQTYEWNRMVDEAIAAYERAAALNPGSTEIMEPLAQRYAQRGDIPQAIALYKRLIALGENEGARTRNRVALVELYKPSGEIDTAMAELRETALSASAQGERDAALRGLWELYTDPARESDGLAALEALVGQMAENSTLYELLGTAYTQAGDPDAAEAAYTRWVELRQKAADRSRDVRQYNTLAEQLLNRGIMPEKALELAQITAYLEPAHYNNGSMLSWAYLANERYTEAAETLKWAIYQPWVSAESSARLVGTVLTRAGKVVKNEERFLQFVEDLIESLPGHPGVQLHAELALSAFYHHRDQIDEANRYLNQTGFVAESAWWIIGPFDNTGGSGYETAHIPEDAVSIDPTAEYDGKAEKVRWEKRRDDTFDGFVDFDQIFGGEIEWAAAYAWTTFNSPDERHAYLRFGSDDQAKIWLNGEEIWGFDQPRTAAIDQHTIPVTLKAGENTLLVKVCDERQFWGFYLRLADMEGGPLP